MPAEDNDKINSFRNREVDVLLMELKVLVNELNSCEITEEEYARKREMILERLIEVC